MKISIEKRLTTAAETAKETANDQNGKTSAADDESEASAELSDFEHPHLDEEQQKARRQEQLRQVYDATRQSLTRLFHRVDFDTLAAADAALAQVRRLYESELSERKKSQASKFN